MTPDFFCVCVDGAVGQLSGFSRDFPSFSTEILYPGKLLHDRQTGMAGHPGLTATFRDPLSHTLLAKPLSDP